MFKLRSLFNVWKAGVNIGDNPYDHDFNQSEVWEEGYNAAYYHLKYTEKLVPINELREKNWEVAKLERKLEEVEARLDLALTVIAEDNKDILNGKN